MEIRPARAGDGRPVSAVRVASWRAAYAGLMPDDLLAGMTVDPEPWETAIASGADASSLLVVDESGIVGFCVLGPDRDGADSTGEIVAMYLHPDVWGRGHGRRLMDASVDALRQHGFTRAVLWVLTTNERARGFYEAAGWTADGGEKTESWGGHPLPHTRYSRPL